MWLDKLLHKFYWGRILLRENYILCLYFWDLLCEKYHFASRLRLEEAQRKQFNDIKIFNVPSTYRRNNSECKGHHSLISWLGIFILQNSKPRNMISCGYKIWCLNSKTSRQTDVHALLPFLKGLTFVGVVTGQGIWV